jgi:hypothetical protein
MKMHCTHHKRWDDEDVENEAQKPGKMNRCKRIRKNHGKIIWANHFRPEGDQSWLRSLPFVLGTIYLTDSWKLRTVVVATLSNTWQFAPVEWS